MGEYGNVCKSLKIWEDVKETEVRRGGRAGRGGFGVELGGMPLCGSKKLEVRIMKALWGIYLPKLCFLEDGLWRW